MRNSRQILLVIIAIIIGIAVAYYFIDPNAYSDIEMLPDGTTVRKVTIDGHLYLKTDTIMTHAESCPHPSHPQNQ